MIGSVYDDESDNIGHLTGIIANQQSVINPDEADKSTHFVHLCNQASVSRSHGTSSLPSGANV